MARFEIILLTGVCLIHLTEQLSWLPKGVESRGIQYDRRVYSGTRPQSIVVLDTHRADPKVSDKSPYNWKPICHGVLINYAIVLAPCSCFSIAVNHTVEVSPWYHPLPSADQIIPDQAQYLFYLDVKRYTSVYLLTNEHDPAGFKTKAYQLQCHYKDNNYHLYDYAMVEILEPLEGSKLAWLHTAEFYTFKASIKKIIVASQRLGSCELYQWSEHTRMVLKDPREAIRNKKFEMDKLYSFERYWALKKYEVRFTEWENCRGNYCPSFAWPEWIPSPPDYLIIRNTKFCNNQQITRKMCLTWSSDLPLCNVTRGTPVFCDITPEFRGLIGIMVDASSYCTDRLYGSMLPLTYAIDFIAPQIRLRSSKTYEDSIPKSIVDLRGLTVWE